MPLFCSIIGIIREGDVAAVADCYEARLHVGRVELRGLVDIGQKADGRTVSVARNSVKHGALVGHLHLISANFFQSLLEQGQQVALLEVGCKISSIWVSV